MLATFGGGNVPDLKAIKYYLASELEKILLNLEF